MTERLEVELDGKVVGDLVEDAGGTTFRFRRSYWDDPDRRVLGQWFEDADPEDLHRGPGSVPAFFANLEPEGPLGRWLARKNHLGSGALELLGVTGDDLVGAVRLLRVDPVLRPPRSLIYHPPAPTPSFSLPGLQLKFPMSLDRDDRLTVPLPDETGEWFVKIPAADRHGGLAENEAATLHWAHCSGFRTAEARVVPAPRLVPELDDLVRPDVSVLLVRRFDRVDGLRIHQEDLAQATCLAPDQKYPREARDAVFFDAASEGRRGTVTSAQGLARYVSRLLGPAGAEEYLRRWIFVIASGNGDAHLKNWAFWYLDGRHPDWTPLYDQVSTIAWTDDTLACPLYGVVNFAAVSREHLLRLAVEAGIAPHRADVVVTETVEKLLAAWPQATAEVPYRAGHRARLAHHWSSVPLLRPFGPLPR